MAKMKNVLAQNNPAMVKSKMQAPVTTCTMLLSEVC